MAHCVKAMMRCFCLWQKRCNFGAMCAFGTLRIKKHPLGCLNIVLLKSQNFDGFLGFFVGSENPSVLSVHGFSGSAKTPERRKIMTFY